MTPPNESITRQINEILQAGYRPEAAVVAHLMGHNVIVKPDPRCPDRLLYERDGKVVGFGPRAPRLP